MKFIVSDIKQNNENIIVCGITEIGVIKGVWKHKELPVMSKAYSVELNYKEYDVRKSYESEKEPYAEIRSDEECVHFCGVCEDIDEDVYFVRFEVDWLDMVEIPEGCNGTEKGDYISFNSKYIDIGIYPY